MGLGYHLHHLFVSKFILQVKTTHYHTRKFCFFFFPGILNIIFLSPAFLWKHFQISSQLRFPNAFRKGGRDKSVTFNYFVKKERNYILWSTLCQHWGFCPCCLPLQDWLLWWDHVERDQQRGGICGCSQPHTDESQMNVISSNLNSNLHSYFNEIHLLQP